MSGERLAHTVDTELIGMNLRGVFCLPARQTDNGPSCSHDVPNAYLQKSIIALAVQKKIFLVKCIFSLGPMPPSGRRTQTGSSGKDTVRSDTFWRKTMKNQPGTMKNHANHDTNLDNHGNQLKTVLIFRY